MKEVFNIKKFKKSIIHIRSSLRILILICIIIFIIISVLAFFYKPVFQVTYNGKILGYIENKSKFQQKINNFIENGNSENSNIAYVEIGQMPRYELSLLKRNIPTDDEKIYNEITSTGITYYNYFAIQLNGENKYYVSTYTDAENIVNQLKEKNSSNINNISILEIYDKTMQNLSNSDTIIAELYEEPKQEILENSPALNSADISGTYIASLGISFVEPTQGIITSRFGVRKRDNHKGLDIANSYGSSIRAAATGTVKYAQYNPGGYGNLVIISHGNGIETYYGHCSKLYVHEGQHVSAGEVISAMGSTGISTGSHLHWEVRINGVAQNPQKYLYKNR